MLNCSLTLPTNSKIIKEEINPTKRGTTFPASPTHLQVFQIVEGGAQTAGVYIYNQAKAQWLLADQSNYPYDIALSVVGKPDANKVVAKVVMPRPIRVPNNFLGSLAVADIAPTAAFTLTVKVGTTTVGTVLFAAGSTVGSFTYSLSGDLIIERGEVLSLTSQATADSTLSFPSITILAEQLHA